MTVAAQTPAISYTGDGVTTVFNFAFRLDDPSWMVATLNGVAAVQGLAYVVEGTAVRFVTPPMAAVQIGLARRTPDVQDKAFPNTNSIKPSSLGDAHDLHTMAQQELREGLGRSLRAPIGETGALLPPAAARRGLPALFADSAEAPLVAGAIADLQGELLTAFGLSLAQQADQADARDLLDLYSRGELDANLEAAFRGSNLFGNAESLVRTTFSTEDPVTHEVFARRTADHSAVALPITVDSYTHTSPDITVTLSGANLPQLASLEIGAPVVFQGAGMDASLTKVPVRVTAKTYTGGPTGTVGVRATANTTPAALGGGGGTMLMVQSQSLTGSGAAPDGWIKETSLYMWIDTWASNQRGSTRRVLAAMKGSAVDELVLFSFGSGAVLSAVQGRRLSFGRYMKARNGGPLVVRPIGYAGAGAVTGMPVTLDNTWKWVAGGLDVPADAVGAQVGWRFEGAMYDSCIMAPAMAVTGNVLPVGYYARRAAETIIPVSGSSLFGHVNATVTLPPLADATGQYFSYPVDIYAESRCAIDPEIAEILIQLEGRSDSINSVFAARDALLPPIKYGPAMSALGKLGGATTVMSFGANWLKTPGGVAWFYSDKASSAWFNLSTDIQSYRAS